MKEMQFLKHVNVKYGHTLLFLYDNDLIDVVNP